MHGKTDSQQNTSIIKHSLSPVQVMDQFVGRNCEFTLATKSQLSICRVNIVCLYNLKHLTHFTCSQQGRQFCSFCLDCAQKQIEKKRDVCLCVMENKKSLYKSFLFVGCWIECYCLNALSILSPKNFAGNETPEIYYRYVKRISTLF